MKKNIYLFITLIFIFAAGSTAFTQDAEDLSGGSTESSELPRVFRKLTLGMNIDDVKQILLLDKEFAFNGDRDVSFLPISKQNLIDTAGLGFIKRAFFQLKDDTLFIMSFSLNTDKIDHYSVFTAFVEKYGEPLLLNPKLAMWENGTTRIFIERPLTVKYIDRKIYDAILSESSTKEAQSTIMREEFLNDF